MPDVETFFGSIEPQNSSVSESQNSHRAVGSRATFTCTEGYFQEAKTDEVASVDVFCAKDEQHPYPVSS